MSSKRDYYEVLGVNRSASGDEIRTAYRNLARQCHPDVSDAPGTEAQFKQINEAYQVLSDTEKRAAYDRFGHAGPGMRGFGSDHGFRDPFEIFEEVFGGGFGFRTTRRRGPRRGSDLRYELSLTFEEAVFGCEEELEITRRELCPRCSGSGAEPGTSPVRCSECNGSGQVRRVQRSILGSFVSVATCPVCQGEGGVITTQCSECRGQKQVYATRRRSVTVPPGVDQGTQIRVVGEGEPGERGGPPGNLYVVLDVEEHPIFQRRGDDIIVELQINVAQAALGAELAVPALEGEETITIQGGAQSGDVISLKGKGVPHLKRSGRGDQIVLLRVAVPKKLTPEQSRLFRELGATLAPEALWREKRSFIDDVRDFLGL